MGVGVGGERLFKEAIFPYYSDKRGLGGEHWEFNWRGLPRKMKGRGGLVGRRKKNHIFIHWGGGGGDGGLEMGGRKVTCASVYTMRRIMGQLHESRVYEIN